jgi:hypothetical protein
MAQSPLTTITGSGVQATTQNQSLQGAGAQEGGPSTQYDSMQPSSVSSDVLTGSGGINLHGTALTTVSLGASGGPSVVSTQVSTGSSATVKLPPHHVNPVLLGGSGLLLVVAIVSFWLTAHSAKNTTQYN